MEYLNNYINCNWAKSKETSTSDIINPAAQEILGKVPNGKATATDVAQAVDRTKAKRITTHFLISLF